MDENEKVLDFKGVVEQKEIAQTKGGKDFYKFKINGISMSAFEVNKAVTESKVGDYAEGLYIEKGNYKNLKTIEIKPLPPQYKKTSEAAQDVMTKDDWMQKEERDRATNLITKGMECGQIKVGSSIPEEWIDYAVDICMRRKPKFKVEFKSAIKEEDIEE